MDPYDRATYALLCGNLQNVLPVCLRWEDHLWARARAALSDARNKVLGIPLFFFSIEYITPTPIEDNLI
jgi:hypothetical protein